MKARLSSIKFNTIYKHFYNILTFQFCLLTIFAFLNDISTTLQYVLNAIAIIPLLAIFAIFAYDYAINLYRNINISFNASSLTIDKEEYSFDEIDNILCECYSFFIFSATYINLKNGKRIVLIISTFEQEDLIEQLKKINTSNHNVKIKSWYQTQYFKTSLALTIILVIAIIIKYILFNNTESIYSLSKAPIMNCMIYFFAWLYYHDNCKIYNLN